jgi:hypothetical protein
LSESGGNERTLLPVGKRSVAREIDKTLDVAKLYFQERMKASKIAKQLRIGVERVYSILRNIKRTAR